MADTGTDVLQHKIRHIAPKYGDSERTQYWRVVCMCGWQSYWYPSPLHCKADFQDHVEIE